MYSKTNIIVFTGAGISAESGIKTFRDNDGLWEKFKVSDVATPQGFKKDPQLVWDFYKQRHDQLDQVEPNQAHLELVKLEELVTKLGYNFILLTQNVDRLHQRAGSKNVYEIHGNLHDIKCSHCDYIDSSQKHWDNDLIPSCPKCGNHLRPNIVWFGEIPDQDVYYVVDDALLNCKAMIVIGTSCQVQPASGLVHRANLNGAELYECNLEPAVNPKFIKNYHLYQGKASEMVPSICKDILNFLTK